MLLQKPIIFKNIQRKYFLTSFWKLSNHTGELVKKLKKSRTSLVAQWLRLCTWNAGYIPGWGLRSYTLHCMAKKKKKREREREFERKIWQLHKTVNKRLRSKISYTGLNELMKMVIIFMILLWTIIDFSLVFSRYKGTFSINYNFK